MSSKPDLERGGASGKASDKAPDKGPAKDKSSPAPPKLLIFRNEIGINAENPLLNLRDRPGQNEGIYKRTVKAEQAAYLNYILTASLINTCLLLQILVAAALTALGAAAASHNAITLLGVLNTAIAGTLTYMKGQNLPNRLRQYWNGLRKLREHIEQRERDFCNPETKLDIDDEVKIVIETYEAVRQNAEDNEPDSYVSNTPTARKRPILPAGDSETTPLLSGLNRAGTGTEAESSKASESKN